MSRFPLGQAESQVLEFKSARIFDKADWSRTMAREVVAFLNTEQGGTLWIGLDEERGVAVKVEDVGDAEARKASLWDALLDRVEPRLAEGEVEVGVVPEGTAGATLLEVNVRGCLSRGPWAALEGTGRHFVVRAGPRMRTLGRDELAAAFQDRVQAPERAERREREAWEVLVARRSTLRASGWSGLWVALRPTTEVHVAALGGEGIAALLREVSLTGNRECGWNFVNGYLTPALDAQGLLFDQQGVIVLRLGEEGMITLQVAFENLHWGTSPEPKGLNPFALMEHPTALLRLAAVLFTHHLRGTAGNDVGVVADLAMLGVEGWSLGPHSPSSLGYRARQHRKAPDLDMLREHPFRWTMGELRGDPDRCARALVVWLYQSFGYPESAIPKEFDPTKGLVFPDR